MVLAYHMDAAPQAAGGCMQGTALCALTPCCWHVSSLCSLRLIHGAVYSCMGQSPHAWGSLLIHGAVYSYMGRLEQQAAGTGAACYVLDCCAFTSACTHVRSHTRKVDTLHTHTEQAGDGHCTFSPFSSHMHSQDCSHVEDHCGSLFRRWDKWSYLHNNSEPIIALECRHNCAMLRRRASAWKNF